MNAGLPYWAWLAAGFAMLIFEMLATSFVLVFFGIGALIVGLTTLVGLTGGINSQLLLFAVSSFASLALLRKTLLSRFSARGGEYPPDYAGSIAKAETDITTLDGYANYRGSQWMAYRVDGHETIPAGSTVEVIGIDGVRLKVRPHHGPGADKNN